jgi:hypothetical protein
LAAPSRRPYRQKFQPGYLVGGIRLLEAVTKKKICADDPAGHRRPRATVVLLDGIPVVAGCDYRYG